MGQQFCRESSGIDADFSNQTTQYHWGYEEHNGPSTWAAHFEAANGTEQSPIDIITTTSKTSNDVETLENTRIVPHYNLCSATVENNGHGVQWTIKEPSRNCHVVRNGVEYNLVQFHYHIPSEHTINSEPKAIEIHFVHQDPNTSELLVVGYCYDPGMTNEFLEPIMNFSPLTELHDSNEVDNIDLSTLNTDAEFVHYKGSLTTPPCSEGVQWYVCKEVDTISWSQISWFRSCIPFDNARPLMPLNGRSCLCTQIQPAKASGVANAVKYAQKKINE